ncbi:heterokaryon incompatibility protein-domain-containing protein [Dactylonectria estremocensis]|uniref:Heterokaryon incompatibility protein-domain-containing protein n=1 Tax=Dactylonectria estremocensis TaxID=1079267 RepID=A0A9P9E5E2_9HYPO|nr:heterokaryon incompatibility protein-domain-containing protein [Dactylonectria estremocensis]
MSLTLKAQMPRLSFDVPTTGDGTWDRRFETGFIKLADIGTYYRQPLDIDCPLCHMLSRLRPFLPRSKFTPERRVDRSGAINRYCNTEERHQLINSNDSFCLAVEPWELPEIVNMWHLFKSSERHGFAVFRRRNDPSPPVFAVQPINRKFDPFLGKMWLDYCQSHHKRLCSRASWQWYTTGLYLIDLWALSYVWGVSPTDDMPNFRKTNHKGDVILPPALPNTISDGIDVSKKLGFQHLWVDRYCIDQRDANVKHDQISQMNSIYHNASLTIIAAAGQNPNYGIPGVVSRRWNKQPAARIGCGDVELLSTMRHPHDTIRSSKWSTRAWTFQEGVLSRRRLVFTDDQAYFECNAMNCYESIASSNNPTNDQQVYGFFDHQKLQPYQVFVRFQRMAEQYSARDLSYDHLEHSLMGGEAAKNLEESFLEGLLRQHKPRIGPDPATDFQNQPRRRTGFPSWSWDGHFKSGIKSLSLELEDGSERTIGDYIGYIQHKALDLPTPSVIPIRTGSLPSSAVFLEASNSLYPLEVFHSSLDLMAPATRPSNPVHADLIFIVIEPHKDTWSRTDLLFVPLGMLPKRRRAWMRKPGMFRIS